MKGKTNRLRLDLVVEYEVCGRLYACAETVPGSYNLARLDAMLSRFMPSVDGSTVMVRPQCIYMARSAKAAKAVASLWNAAHRRAGRLYDFTPVQAGKGVLI